MQNCHLRNNQPTNRNGLWCIILHRTIRDGRLLAIASLLVFALKEDAIMQNNSNSLVMLQNLRTTCQEVGDLDIKEAGQFDWMAINQNNWVWCRWCPASTPTIYLSLTQCAPANRWEVAANWTSLESWFAAVAGHSNVVVGVMVITSQQARWCLHLNSYKTRFKSIHWKYIDINNNNNNNKIQLSHDMLSVVGQPGS